MAIFAFEVFRSRIRKIVPTDHRLVEKENLRLDPRAGCVFPSFDLKMHVISRIPARKSDETETTIAFPCLLVLQRPL